MVSHCHSLVYIGRRLERNRSLSDSVLTRERGLGGVNGVTLSLNTNQRGRVGRGDL